MMKILTGEQMRTLDQKAIRELGIPGIILMENAGRGVFEHMLDFWQDIDSKKIGICCGGGNNGGDGFVVARYLMNRGQKPEVFLFADQKKVRGDAKINLDILINTGGRVYVIPDQDALNTYKDILGKCHIIVDAIFGTGLKPPVTGFLAETIQFINGLQKEIVAVDIPSGLGSDSPKITGSCIKANLTVTFALPKVSHLLPPAMDMVGDLRIVDIGIPDFLINENEYEIMALDLPFLAPFLKKRLPNTHKGNYGHCLIIAGSEGKTGAACLAAQAALRIGAGLVTLGIPASLNDIVEIKLTEAMTLPLPETEERTLSVRALPRITEILPRISSIAIGPGLSQNPETGELVRKMINEIGLPMVIDADAINLIAGEFDLIKKAGHTPVLTPHPGEMARLIGSSVVEVLSGRPDIVKQHATEGGCYLVLKGYHTLMANPGGDIFLNLTGNPGMATGGMGDILTGMMAGLMAQGYSKQDSMLLSVYIHGLAGDLAAEIKGEEGLIATDLFDTLPKALRLLNGN